MSDTSDDDFMNEFSDPAGPDSLSQQVKRELMEMILWNERESPRSKQSVIGPSELGTECDRRIAYKLASVPPVNLLADPWPAIVGTSIHDWLEKAINRYQSHHGDKGWMTELGVYPDPLVKGRSDVYSRRLKMVVDHKSAGADVMRKVNKGQIPKGYIVQIQVYGLGHVLAGRPVEHVALAFYPRSGWLDDMVVWRTPYDESVARGAIERMYKIGYKLLDLEIAQNPHRFGFIEASPGDNCAFCPYFSREMHQDVAPSEKGCPGK